MMNQIGQRFGNCIPVRLVGHGGFADVYQARHVYLETDIAIKVLKMHIEQDDRQNFLKEAQIVASLDHPHIIRVLDFGMKGSVPYLVMSYAPHGSLREHYPRGNKPSFATILTYLRQLADALEYIHKQGLIHQDIKPENILLGKNHEILLSDFGIAILASRTNSREPHQLFGSISYMAPERLQGHSNPASDQYSLGITVYEWLVGELPFRGSPEQIAWQHINHSPPSMRARCPEVPPEIERVVLKSLEKDPRQRFESVRDFVESFEETARVSITLSPARSQSALHLELRSLEETAHFFIFDVFAAISLSIVSILFGLGTTTAWFILGLSLIILPTFSAFALKSRLSRIIASWMLFVSLVIGITNHSMMLVSITQMILITFFICIAFLVRFFSNLSWKR